MQQQQQQQQQQHYLYLYFRTKAQSLFRFFVYADRQHMTFGINSFQILFRIYLILS